MKKALTILMAAAMLALTACGSSGTATAYPEVNTLEGVSLEIQEDTQKTTKATFILANASDEAVEYKTNEYHMEKLEDGAWMEMTGTAESAWGDETATLEAGESLEIPCSWKVLCGATTKGEAYRLIMIVNDTAVAAEFSGV